jgi:hypothetical protein
MKRRLLILKRQLGWRVLAWSALVGITLTLVVVVQALAASSFAAPERATLTDSCRAALVAGNHVRESFLTHSCS